MKKKGEGKEREGERRREREKEQETDRERERERGTERETHLTPSLQSLWHIVGSIIHLGNLEYEAGSEGHARFKNPKLIKTIAKVT